MKAQERSRVPVKGRTEDREIIYLLNKRDERAVAALAEKYGGLCRSLIRNILRDERDVEECLNSVYMGLWSKIPPADPHDLKAYIAKAARNEALMRHRSNRSRGLDGLLPFEEIADCLPSAETEAESREVTRLINRFIEGLDLEKRRVFIRRYWFMDSVPDIAKRFSMSESKVSSMLLRLRAKLKKYLESEGISL